MTKIHAVFLLTLLFFGFCGQYTNEQKLPISLNYVDRDIVNVGVIVDMGSWEGKVVRSCIKMAVSDFYSRNSRYRTRVQLHFRETGGDSLLATAAAIDLLENVEVVAIIVPTMTNKELFLAKLSDNANVPLLSFSSVSASDIEHPYFFQVAEDETAQFHAIASFFRASKWTNCAILYEDTADARRVQSYLYDILHESRVHVASQIAISPKATDDKMIVHELHKLKSSVIVVHMSPSLASQTLVNAKKLGMMSKGYAWIMTSKAMNSLDLHDSLIHESMEGVIGFRSSPIFYASTQSRGFTLRWRKELIRLYEPDTEIRELNVVGVQAYDAVWALADAIERAEMKPQKKKVQVKVLDLGRLRVSNSGAALSSEISRSKFIGLGGEFRLVNRKLVREAYEIVNVMGKGGRRVGFWTSAFGFSKDLYDHHRHDHEFNKSSSSTLDNIIWPGLSLNAPTSRLVQMSGRKYRFLVPGKGFPEFVSVHYDQERNVTTFDGFSIDVFHAAIARLPYDVSVEFITFVNGSYNNMVMQVYLQGYDGAVGDITITPNRSQYVDFSMPYTDLGVAVVAKLDVQDPWFFLRPLRPELWIISGCFFVLTGFVVWLIEHRTNSQFQGSPAQQMGTILWFAASTLVYAHREKLEHNLSKFVVGVWLFVVLILTSSYTANLSSLLTVQQIQLSKHDYVGYWSGNTHVQGVTKSNLNFADNRLKPYQSPFDYYDALSQGSKNGGVSAIVDEIPYIKLFLAKYTHIKYSIIESLMITNGFGFAFPKGSPLVHEISAAIVQLREEGKLSELEKKWSTSGSSEPMLSPDSAAGTPHATNTHSIDSFYGLFLVSGISKAIAVVGYLVLLLRERFVGKIISVSSNETTFEI